MNTYSLRVDTTVNGGYLSSEQIDLLSIIQCNSLDELINFIIECDQINHLKDIENIISDIKNINLENAKRKIFKIYQDTMVYHDDKESSILKRLEYLNISKEEVQLVIDGIYPNSKELLELNHHYVSEERDGIKSSNLYEELVILNKELKNLNTILIGSGKIYNVVNKYISDSSDKYDFYHAKRDLDFAYRNGKHVRYHSLLVRNDCGLFDGKSKEEIINLIKEYVKVSIDFINNYNSNHNSIINAVDLFNEIVSFDKDEEENYFNIWNKKYNISMNEILSCFDYALQNKPKGVSYLYNEPFLENDDRRKKVFKILNEIDTLKPGLIDTLGTQMHITVRQDLHSIERCFNDFKRVQDATGKKIQITEFDMSLGKNDIFKVFGPNANVTVEEVYNAKEKSILEISNVINNSGVKLSGISYWSLTDGQDFNLERIRSEALSNHIISNINEIPTVCGGLIPTYILIGKILL